MTTAPEPSPAEQAVIDRFGIFDEDLPPSERMCAGGVRRSDCCGLPGACGDC